MTTLFNYDPYFDDFNEDKNFMRVLFRPGYAVQARELTQLQTILSNQIEKFGNHIFKSGSPITGGKISLDNRAKYLILQSQYEGSDIDIENFLNKTIISFNSTKNVRAKVIAIDNTTTTTPTLVLKYLSGEYFSEDDEIKVYGQNYFAKARSTNAVGTSYVASIQEGVYYFKGQFVKVTPQFLVLELFHKVGYDTRTINSQPSWKVGIEFEDTIVDEIDDTSLLDPAQGAFNYQAPGAHRYQITTRLSKRTLDSADESSFFEVIRLVNGVKTKEIDYPIYNELEKTMARRTYDESGNYTVDPFILSMEEGDSANGKFNVILDPGKAYVGGYEFQTIAPTKIQMNRSRLTNEVLEYDLSTNYTSYVVLNSVRGTLEIPSFPQLDIHCVPQANVNVSTTAAYNSTKIGSLNASMLKYTGADDANLGTTHKFNVNVFNVNGSPISGTVRTGSTNTIINLPTEFSTSVTANAYANMYFRLTDSSLSAIKILESDGSALTITLSEALPFSPTSANTFSIESDFKVAESLVSASGSSIIFAGDVDDESKDTQTGYSYINEPKRNSLIFDVPFDSIKANTITDFDYFARKTYSAVSALDGTSTISAVGTDTFAFAGTPGVLSDSVILNNIICFINSDSTANAQTGIVANTVLSLANNNFTVTADNNQQITINFGQAGVRADLIITTRINNAENGTTGTIRGKQLIPLTSGADLHAKVPYELDTSGDTLEAANSSVKTVVSGVGTVFNDIGATYFDDSTILQQLRTPGVSVSLQVPDVYEIVRITDSLSRTANVTTAMLTSTSNDVTDNFEFDNGQRKTHYDHATIKLKRGYSSPKGKIYVQYKYLKHQNAPSPQNRGLFTVDSYLKDGSNFTYDQISVFNNKEDSKQISLRSAMDFRPTRQIGGTAITGAINPDPDLTGSFTFEHYLSRIDRIVVKPSKEFYVVEGKSAVNPTAPSIQDDDMLIYTIKLPPYTETVVNIETEFHNNRRFTMKDIGNFDKRIKSLEYYVSLNALEKDTTSLKILDSNGLERSKYGILVDNFATTTTQATYEDVGFDNRCLIENNELKPASLMRTFKLELNQTLSDGSTYGVGDKSVMMLDYTTSSLASQLKATKAINVAEALFANFYGTSRLYPEYTADVDTETVAKTVLNPLNGFTEWLTFYNTNNKLNADATGAWSSDKNSPFAKIPTSSWYTESSSSTTSEQLLSEEGYIQNFGNILTSTTNTYLTTNYALQQQDTVVSTSQIDSGSYVTDISIQPYIKSQEIIFVGESLRPNRRYFAYFDEVPVSIGAFKRGRFARYSTIVIPNNVTINISSGNFYATEKAIIANSSAELTTFISSYQSGGTNYKLISITNREPGSNNFSVVNKSAIDTMSEKYVYGVSSGARGQVSSLIDHKSGLVRSTTSTTIELSPDAPSVNISGNVICFAADTGNDSGHGYQFYITDYNTTTKVATVSPMENAPNQYTPTGNWIYSIGQPQTNQYGQLSCSFFPKPNTFRNGERTFRMTESFNDSYDEDSVSFTETTFISSGIKLEKTDLVSTVYNIGTKPKIVGYTSSTEYLGSSVTNTVTSRWSVDNTPPPPPASPPPAPTPETSIDWDILALFADDSIYETLTGKPKTSIANESYYWGDLGTGEGSVYGWIPVEEPSFEYDFCGGDPLAQTFYIDSANYPYGVSIDSIDLFFRSVDDENIPVSVEIRPTVNATPHADYWYPESVVTKFPNQINVSENPSVTDTSSLTNFKFESPVFLKPGMYCVVIKTDSPDYSVWVAEKGSNTLTGEFVGINPYVGTLYKSQNAMEYVPIINEDLMFRLNRCVFSVNTTSTYYLQSPTLTSTNYFDAFRILRNQIQTISDDVVSVNYSFISKPVGSSKETTYREIYPGLKYSMGDDDLYAVGNRRKELTTKGDFTLKIEMTSFNNAVSPVIGLESLYLNAWENFIDNCSISSEDFNIIEDGSGYSNSNTVIINSTTGSGAEIYLVTDGVNGNIVGFNVVAGGSGYTDDFSITIADTSDPSGNITANATVVLNSEYDESGGPADARYITKPITLADGFDSGDLRVILNGNIPVGTDIHVYYKVLSASDNTPFRNRPYMKMSRVNPSVVASKTSREFTEFEYRPSLTENAVTYVSEDGVTYDNFKTFAIKIVLTSLDPSVISKVRDLRIIALPAE